MVLLVLHQDLSKIEIENFKKVLNVNVFTIKINSNVLKIKSLEQLVNITSEMGSISNNISEVITIIGAQKHC